MRNAKDELLRHIEGRDVKYILTWTEEYDDSDSWEPVLVKREGPLTHDLLAELDFTYDSGYGAQHLFGYIWYEDGTWSERHEYDGAEGWEHKSCPPLPDSYRDMPL